MWPFDGACTNGPGSVRSCVQKPSRQAEGHGMHVIAKITPRREHTMTQKKLMRTGADRKALLSEDAELMRELVRHVMQEILEAEMTEALGAGPGERTEARLGYRAGYYPRTLVTRVGKLELRVPRDRDGRGEGRPLSGGSLPGGGREPTRLPRHRGRPLAHRRPTISAEKKLDGRYLLRSRDPSLSAEDIALGYKQLLEVERGWRDIKHVLDLRPVYHRKEERIRAHVLLCRLALLLIRICETSCGDT